MIRAQARRWTQPWRWLLWLAALILLAWNLPLNLSSAPALEEKWQDVTRPWRATRDRLIAEHPSSANVLKPFLRGQRE